ncbi:hypothetical protein IXEL_22 [Microbacterium phage Ixel]|nr:hypothetical protein IXEL_22 [Microbacterium phage Ixel]
MTYPTINLPRIEEVVPGAFPSMPTDDEDRAWNAHCTELVKAFAKEHGIVRTHYPFDLPDGSSDDTVTLDDSGEIIILDAGVQ